MSNPYKITDPAEQRNFTIGPRPHPGRWIDDVLLEPLGLDVEAAAEQMDIEMDDLQRVIDGSAPVTIELADRLQELTGIDAMLLLRMQVSHERDHKAP